MGLKDMLPRAVPVRLGHRRAQGPRHGDHPRARGAAARRLYRRHRPYRAVRRCPVQRGHPHRVLDGNGGARWASAAASSPTSKVDAEFEECLLKAHFLTKVDSAVRADRDHALRAGPRLPSARAASRAAAILRRSFRLSVLARGGAGRARRRGRARRGAGRYGAAAARRGRHHHRDLDRDHAAHQGYGVAVRDLRPARSTRRIRCSTTRPRGGSSTTARWSGKRR